MIKVLVRLGFSYYSDQVSHIDQRNISVSFPFTSLSNKRRSSLEWLVSKPAYQISGKIIARDTTINLIGRVIPIIVAIATISYAVHKLGVERFGILALAMTIIGYFTIFDMGLGQGCENIVKFTSTKQCGTSNEANHSI